MGRTKHTTSTDALTVLDLTKIYPGAEEVTALDGVSLTLPRGSFTAVMGPSGSGKSTLLQCAAGLDRPTSGEVWVDGTRLPVASEAQATRFRRDRIGFVFQAYNLLPHLTVAENIDLPQRFTARRTDKGRRRDVLERLGLSGLVGRRASELSGGQQQRVAIARSLVAAPTLLFADEPTGALDVASGREVLGLLREAVDTFGRTVVLVTHDPAAAARADSTLFLADGAIVDHVVSPSVQQVAERMTTLTEQAASRALAGNR